MNTTPTAWRYLNVACVADDLPSALERFGAEGWELAAALPMNFPAPQGRLIVNGTTQAGVLLIFKRPVTPEPEEKT